MGQKSFCFQETAKISPCLIESAVKQAHRYHYPKPRVLPDASDGVGNVYSIDELRELTEVARRLNLRVHMDGARLANAVVSLGVAPKEITWKAA